MKLIEFSRYEYVNLLRRQMGADKLGDFAHVETVQQLTPIELDQLIGGGIDVSIDDIRILHDGTLGYKDSRVLIYSRDVPLASEVSDTVWKIPRFHFANCKKLKDARKNRGTPYAVAINEDGNFSIHKIHMWGRTEYDVFRLVVCEHCLNALSYDGYSHDMPEHTRRRILDSFSIWRFFKSYPKCLVAEDSARASKAEANTGQVRDVSELGSRLKRVRGYDTDIRRN